MIPFPLVITTLHCVTLHFHLARMLYRNITKIAAYIPGSSSLL